MIDKSLRQYYRDGENVGPYEKGKKTIVQDNFISKSVPDSPNWKKQIVDGITGIYLGTRIPGGTKTIKQLKSFLKGDKSLTETLGNIPNVLRNSYNSGNWKSPTNVLKVFNLAQKSGIPGGKGFLSLVSKVLPFVGIAGGAMLANKYREQITGYPTQVAYEQAQQGRIDASRAQMRLAPKTKENLKINWERQGFNDDEIREKERKYDEETAELLGATVIDDQIILGQDYFPDLGGDPEGQAEASPTVSETAATEDININQAPVVTPLPVFQPPQRAPTPVHHWTPSGNGGGGQNGGGGYRGDPGGGAAGSPFKKGGRIDKALGGRSRDI